MLKAKQSNYYTGDKSNEYPFKYINAYDASRKQPVVVSDSDNNNMDYASYQALTNYYFPANYNNINKQETNKTKESNISQQKQQPPKKANATTTAQTKSLSQEIKCHKKFSVGNYVHMLNEPVEPPVKDNTTIEKKAHLYFHDDDEEINNEDYYHSLRPKSANGKPAAVGSNDTKKQTINEITDLDRIAAKINSTGQQKWKNSFVPAKSSRFLDLIFVADDY